MAQTEGKAVKRSEKNRTIRKKLVYVKECELFVDDCVFFVSLLNVPTRDKLQWS